MYSRASRMLLAFGMVAAALSDSPAEEALHQRIDRQITVGADEFLADRTTDSEFVRRIYLDLVGRVPIADETRQFLADDSADKRAALVDRLLADRDYPRRMRDAFHVMLMERLGDHTQWSRYLEEAFASNKPWNQIVGEILKPDPGQEAVRGADFFYTRRLVTIGQRETDYPGLTRDVGRLFLGMDLQCAQCHDHPYVGDYGQHDFQGLLVAFENTFIRDDLDFPAVGERPLAKPIQFVSVFTGSKGETGPRIPRGMEISIPAFSKDAEYLVPPDRKAKFPGIPKFSPLAEIAEQLTRAARSLAQPIDLGVDGVYYLGLTIHAEQAIKVGGPFERQGRSVRLLLRTESSSERDSISFAFNKSLRPIIETSAGRSFVGRTTVPLNSSVRLIAKILTRTQAEDELSLVFLDEQEKIEIEPPIWDVTTRGVQLTARLQDVFLASHGPAARDLDNLRIGATWWSVLQQGSTPWCF